MYDELDDMGTGYEEAAEREYDRREEAAIHAVRFPDEAILSFFAPIPCDCAKGDTDAAVGALLTGRCARCGWGA
jgi:hypothetical protein